MLLEIFKILKYAWPFLREVFFGKGTIAESMRKHWIIWTYGFVNTTMFLIICFLGWQDLVQATFIDKNKLQPFIDPKVYTANIKEIADLKLQVADDKVIISKLEVEVDNFKKAVEPKPPPSTPAGHSHKRVATHPSKKGSDTLTQALNKIQ